MVFQGLGHVLGALKGIVIGVSMILACRPEATNLDFAVCGCAGHMLAPIRESEHVHVDRVLAILDDIPAGIRLQGWVKEPNICRLRREFVVEGGGLLLHNLGACLDSSDDGIADDILLLLVGRAARIR